jgi:hypothetical protein
VFLGRTRTVELQKPFFAVGDRQVAALFVATTVASALV